MKYLMLALELRGLTPRATYVMLASFQAIIDLGKNARVVMEAQKARGIETDGSLLTRLRAFFPILAPVFLAAMNQTEERAIALDARAFNSRVRHSHLVTLRPTRPWEKLLLALAIAALGLSTLGALLSWF
jgi:energy-coupling factor transporter transmembrane protein EcfT